MKITFSLLAAMPLAPLAVQKKTSSVEMAASSAHNQIEGGISK